MSTQGTPQTHDGDPLVELVAANVRAEASRAGMSQKRLAMAIGVSAQTVSTRWSGRRQWQLEDLARVGRVLGVDPADFLRGELPRLDSNQQPSGYPLSLVSGYAGDANPPCPWCGYELTGAGRCGHCGYSDPRQCGAVAA